MNTLRLIGKEIRRAAPAFGVFLAAFAAVSIFGRVVSDRLLTSFLVMISAFHVASVMLIIERYEDRNNGYRFLLRMPVRAAEVAAAKLILLYLLNGVSCALMLAAARINGEGVGSPAFGFVFLFGCVLLAFVALMYTGIFLLGYTRFILVFRISIMGILVVVQVVLFMLLRSRERGVEIVSAAVDSIAAAPWLPVCAAVTAVFFLFVPVGANLIRRHAASGN